MPADSVQGAGVAGANRVPVSVITGFLGSGKTTLLNRLVRHPGMADTALIVNEFGDVGIDHALVDSSFENTVVMDSGCICCSIRGDLVDTIGDLFANVALGRVPSFSRIVIETTGLADPTPIVHAIGSESVVAERCRLDTIVTTVDAQNGARQLDTHDESVRQVALADVAVVTKTDLVSAAAVRDLAARLVRLNPGLPVRTARHGEIDPAQLFAGRDGVRALAALGGDTAQGAGPHDDHHDHAHDADLDRNRHGDIRAYTILADDPLPWQRLRLWLETVFSLRGGDFLRLKGIIALHGMDRPVVLQGVGNTFSPPETLPRWPDDDHRSRIVLITRGLAPEALQRSFDAFVRQGIAGTDAAS